jgi:L-cysteine/cystine lyase
MTFEEARAAFPVLKRLAYLNAGTMGPIAQATADAISAEQRADLEHGRVGKPYFDRMLELRAEVRTRLAGLLGVPAELVALTTSTTQGCNIVLAGLGLRPEDEIVTTDVEHFGLLGAMHVSGGRVRVAKVRERPAAEALDAILAEVGRRTRFVAVSHVAWTTGHLLPVRELKERLDVPLLVDGAQSVGAIPVEAEEFDFYTVSAQKWLCGPDSTGALYVADPEGLRVTAPTYFGQEDYGEAGSFTPRAGALRFDGGWIPTSSLAGLLAALDTAPEWRFARAAEAAARCRELLAERVEVVTEPGQATLVSFRPEEDPAELAARLYEQGVGVRALPGTGWVRASCGYWTSDGDLERLVAGL